MDSANPHGQLNLNSDDAPKKYIRTFAGDMEILKRGGKPDLKPLAETPVIVFDGGAPSEKLYEPTPPPPLPAAPPPVPPPPPEPPIVPVAPTPQPIAPPAPAPEPFPIQIPPYVPPAPFRETVEPLPTPVYDSQPEIKPEIEKPFPLQTYSDDFSQRVKETNASTATVLAAEQDSAVGEPIFVQEKTSHGGLISVIAGIILLLVGSAGAYLAYKRFQTNTQPVAVAPTAPATIFVDERENISGTTASEIRKTILSSVARALAPNTIRLLYVSATTTNLFPLLEPAAPDVLKRNVNATSIAGVINAGGQSPFFILSVASYSDTFAGMLAWEPTMLDDLKDLYPSFPVAPIATTTMSKKGNASTTPSIALPTYGRALFHDEVVNNHDVRVYRDLSGRSVLIYGYWNQGTLVIARDPAAFTELLGRLATTRAQ